MNDKYTKVVYQSDPIGKERIVLYLTTFDLEAFEKDQKLEKIPTQTIAKSFEIPEQLKENSSVCVDINAYNQQMFETMIEKFIVETYDEQLQNLKQCVENLRKTKIVPIEYDNNAKNITNSDDVHCNIVYGNITNCDNVYCSEIKGNVVNCDKIIYKKGSGVNEL